MELKKIIPSTYDEAYEMDFETQATLIEVSITNSFILNQLTMPMVAQMDGGQEILAMFRSFVAAEILAFIRKGLLSEEFYKENKGILDEEHGICPGLSLNTMRIYNLAYDLQYLISRYMVAMGWEDSPRAKQNFPYGNTRFFPEKR